MCVTEPHLEDGHGEEFEAGGDDFLALVEVHCPGGREEHTVEQEAVADDVTLLQRDK